MAERAAAFLDRDGTLIPERHYLSDPDGVTLIDGVAGALRRLAGAGFALVLVTNQSGIARGLLTEADYRAVHRRLERVLEAAGVTLDGAYHCPHHPSVSGPCGCRKPGHALFRRAADELGLAFGRSVFIGDRLRDVAPALELGGRAIIVRTGYGAGAADAVPEAVTVARDLPAAVDTVLGADPG